MARPAHDRGTAPRRAAGRERAADGDGVTRTSTTAAIERTFREEAAAVTSRLTRLLGDFDLAEELVQEAILAALEHWPSDGVPDAPAAWLLTVARRRGVDRLRREARYRRKLALLEEASTNVSSATDDRLDLIFMCCHPALVREAQIALTLRSVLGLTTGEIARSLLVSEATLAQRIVRAKRKIVEARIALRRPEGPELLDRLEQVRAVIYLVFNEGHLATAGAAPMRRDLMLEAEWLASEVVRVLSDDPETLGLLALIRLHLARADTRFDEGGRMVLLRDQDRSRWDRGRIAGAVSLLDRAGAMKRPGPYQVQAAIAALHAEAPSWSVTDWPQILRLYDALLLMTGSPVVRLNRAIALGEVAGADAALREVDALAEALPRYHLFHATRAALLRDLGRSAEAQRADRRALQLTENPAERALLQERLAAAEAER